MLRPLVLAAALAGCTGSATDDTGEPSCTDAFEPNDAPEDAAALAFGGHEDLVLCPGETDRFSFVVPGTTFPEGHRVRVEIDASDWLSAELTGPDLDAERVAVDPGGTAPAWSFDTAGGDLALALDREGYDQAAPVTYDLEVTAEPIPCLRDRYEGAGTVTLEPGHYDALSICAADTDAYTVLVQPGTDGRATLRYDASKGALSMRVTYEENGLTWEPDPTSPGLISELLPGGDPWNDTVTWTVEIDGSSEAKLAYSLEIETVAHDD